ncbi:hypothetical protein ACP70R_020650 [Stipagrostis hirtigluma subsp. patula]
MFEARGRQVDTDRRSGSNPKDGGGEPSTGAGRQRC